MNYSKLANFYKEMWQALDLWHTFLCDNWQVCDLK